MMLKARRGKVANQRLDYIHKVTHQLTHDSQVRTICIEDLNVKGMLKNHHLAYNIADASISRFYQLDITTPEGILN